MLMLTCDTYGKLVIISRSQPNSRFLLLLYTMHIIYRNNGAYAGLRHTIVITTMLQPSLALLLRELVTRK